MANSHEDSGSPVNGVSGDVPGNDGREPVAAPRKRLTAAERRRGILRAARREFARSGYHGASTAAIASSAGCSEPMLYKHFPGKQALFAAVLEDSSRTLDEQIASVLEQPGHPFEHWMRFLPQAMASEEFAEQVAIRSLAVTLADDPVIRAALRSAIDSYTVRVKRAIDHLKATDEDAPELDHEYVAWVWFGLSMAAAFRWAIDGPDGFRSMLPHAQQFFCDLYPALADARGRRGQDDGESA